MSVCVWKGNGEAYTHIDRDWARETERAIQAYIQTYKINSFMCLQFISCVHMCGQSGPFNLLADLLAGGAKQEESVEWAIECRKNEKQTEQERERERGGEKAKKKQI